MMLTLIVGHLLKFQNTYWISISTVAIIQGRNFEHVRQRNMHRIFGTFIGLGLAWLILLFDPEKMVMIGIIVVLQFVVELMIVRNYGFAVIFITPLTLLLIEVGSTVHHQVENLMEARLLDTIIGSLMGLAAGFFFIISKSLINWKKTSDILSFSLKNLKNKIMRILVVFAFMLMSCNPKAQDSVTKSQEDLKTEFSLPKKLKEVSGIALSQDQK
ncbi:FUSC family protein [Chryseobacterium indoltheticum]|uniref:FUSC family protein n=1 Tax=Chryseobacterium indoltheticum TaxID=254 RepID=UPI003F496C93